MPGYDPILDGTAAPHFVAQVKHFYEEDTWEITFPDGETVLVSGREAMWLALQDWYEAQKDPERYLKR